MGQKCWGDLVGLPASGVERPRLLFRGCNLCLRKELCLIVGFGLHESCARGVMRPRGLCGAGKAAWVWAWGSLTCAGRVLFAGARIRRYLIWVSAKKSVNN